MQTLDQPIGASSFVSGFPKGLPGTRARMIAVYRPDRVATTETNMASVSGKGQDRVVLVTGGMGGLGETIATKMVDAGYRVVVTYSPGNAKHKEWVSGMKDNGYDILAVKCDVADIESCAHAVAEVQDKMGAIDILVNNAGITGGNATTWELSPEVWRRVIEVNLVAPYLVCRAVVPHMIAAKYGRIVNIASVAGKEGNPNASHYSASKAGVIALTKSLGKELATKGVIVNAITPAAAKTAMFATMTQQHIDFMLSKIPMGRFLEVDEAAAMVAWLASEECSFTTGSVIDISGGRATY